MRFMVSTARSTRRGAWPTLPRAAPASSKQRPPHLQPTHAPLRRLIAPGKHALHALPAVRRCADGSELPIIAVPGGKLYVLSEEGCEFDVVVECSRNFPTPMFSGMIYGVGGSRMATRHAVACGAPR